MYVIDFSFADADHIFNEYLPDGEELTVFVKIIRQVRFGAVHGIIIV